MDKEIEIMHSTVVVVDQYNLNTTNTSTILRAIKTSDASQLAPNCSVMRHFLHAKLLYARSINCTMQSSQRLYRYIIPCSIRLEVCPVPRSRAYTRLTSKPTVEKSNIKFFVVSLSNTY